MDLERAFARAEALARRLARAARFDFSTSEPRYEGYEICPAAAGFSPHAIDLKGRCSWCGKRMNKSGWARIGYTSEFQKEVEAGLDPVTMEPVDAAEMDDLIQKLRRRRLGKP